MANALDVAGYILKRRGTTDTWALQKLLYLGQGWHLAWYGEPLFGDRVAGWVNGPVTASVYVKHRGTYSVDAAYLASEAELQPHERATVDEVLRVYGGMDGETLADLTHLDPPWLESRIGLGPKQSGDREVSLKSMREHFSQLAALGSKRGEISHGVELGLLAWRDMTPAERKGAAHLEPAKVDADAFLASMMA